MKLLCTLALGLALGVVLPQLAAAQAPGLATFPVGTTTVTAPALAANLSTIWELAWGPDNFIWMTERGGRISRVNPATGQVSVLLALPDVTESNESGLLGLAVMEPFPASGPLVASEAQNRASLNGKILRMSLDGTIPADNPAPGSLVYTLGHRNPQGLVQLPNGRIYSSEHGPNTDDEVNRIEAGRNYGWPNVEGYCDLSAEATFCAANNVREPLTAWTPTIAPAGLSYYDHPAIPGWRGSLLLAVLKGSSSPNSRSMRPAAPFRPVPTTSPDSGGCGLSACRHRGGYMWAPAIATAAATPPPPTTAFSCSKKPCLRSHRHPLRRGFCL